MSKESNIDKLFREALENQDNAFNPDAWNAMESMLDEKDKGVFKRRMARASIAASLLLISAGGWWFASDSQTSPAVHAELNTTSNAQSAPTNDLNPESSQKKTTVENEVALNEINTASPVSTSSVEARVADNMELMAIRQTPADLASPENEELMYHNSGSELSFYTEYQEQNNITEIKTMKPVSFTDYEMEEEFLAVAPSGDPVDAKSLIQQKNGFRLTAATTFNHGFGNGSGLFGNNLINALGFEYSRSLNSKLTLISGLNLSSKSGNGLEASYTQEEYGFGKTVTTNTVKVRSMYYLELPVLVDFNFGRKHHVFGGVQVGYLLGVKNDIQQQQTETLSGTSSNNEVAWGRKDLHNPINLSLRAGYEYEISPKFLVGVNGQFGLTDHTTNDTWNSQNFHQELQISLKYKLFQF